MISFSEYSSFWLDIDNYEGNTAILENGLSKLLFQKSDSEYAILIPKPTADIVPTNTAFQIRAFFKEHKYAMYPIACISETEPFRSYVVVKKPRDTSGDFRHLVSESYRKIPNLSVLYTDGKIIKSLNNGELATLEESPCISRFNEVLSYHIGNSCRFLGVEIPTTPLVEKQYHQNALLKLPHTLIELNDAKTWKDYEIIE